MIRNYLKIAFRNILKYRFISGINIFGLTVGLTCCLLIAGYIINETSFDRHHPDAENTYRVERTFLNPETGAVSLNLGTIAPAYTPILLNDFKEIKKLTRFYPNGRTSIKYEDKLFNEKDVFYADENLFDVFSVDLLKGNPAKALKEPYSVMLTEDIAKKYFGNDEPLNKVIRLDNRLTCKVTGVYKPFASNAHMHPNALISFSTLNDTAVYGAERLATSWGNNSFLTYITLPPGTDAKAMEARFPAFQDKHIHEDPTSRFKTSQYSVLTLRKLTDIHLRSHTDYEAEENGDVKRIYIFGSIALFILLIACINYMNLSTARSALRAKEIGVRKVAGAMRSELIGQFLSESILISFIAMLLAAGATYLLMPAISKLTGQTLSPSLLFNAKVIVPMLLAPFVIGLLSGIYPALVLSSFRPVKVLKGLVKTDGGIAFRKSLVVVQFAVSIILIVATVVVFQQLRYMKDKSLGFDKDQVVTLLHTPALDNSFEAFRNALLANGNIKNVARSSRIPSGRLLDAMPAKLQGADSMSPVNTDIKFVVTDGNFLPTYNIKTVAGRGFASSTDTSIYLLNEAAAKALSLDKDQAIGRKFTYGEREGVIGGIIQDFHFESLHQNILPLVIYEPRRPGAYNAVSVKISENPSAALAHLEKVWKQFVPEAPFDYTFLDERYAKLYESENRQSTIFTVFASLAIFIACLGLLGLSAFAISQRVKEIGIRKVLGASAATIVNLLSIDFLKLVLLAACIALPVAWLAMNSWLKDFAYRVNIQWWVFILASLVAAIVAFLTISLQALKAANANPVKSLRAE